MSKHHFRGMVLLAAGFAAFACGSKDSSTVKPAAQGQRGETCQARNDCEPGLACVRSTCTLNDFPIAVTTKQCSLIQCTTTADCCNNFTVPPYCATYQSECASGITTSCTSYNQYCVCNQECTDNKCVTSSSCTVASDCFVGNTNACVAGKCVECAVDTDCFSNNASCVDNKCQTKCATNDDCQLLETCQSGACVQSGCASDRQCIGFTQSPDAKCIATKCQVPCQNDAECSYLEACQNGTCTFIGCDTNDDCRYLLQNFNPGSGYSAVCK